MFLLLLGTCVVGGCLKEIKYVIGFIEPRTSAVGTLIANSIIILRGFPTTKKIKNKAKPKDSIIGEMMKHLVDNLYKRIIIEQQNNITETKLLVVLVVSILFHTYRFFCNTSQNFGEKKDESAPSAGLSIWSQGRCPAPFLFQQQGNYILIQSCCVYVCI